MNILELKHITYAYDRTPVLNDVSMTFEDGACYAIVGPSGAGKTTLLSLMSGLTAIQDGDILYQGKSLRQMNMYDYRSHDAGIIFQHYNLLTKLTALENVELSMEISGIYLLDNGLLGLSYVRYDGKQTAAFCTSYHYQLEREGDPPSIRVTEFRPSDTFYWQFSTEEEYEAARQSVVEDLQQQLNDRGIGIQ